jgi:acetyl-CoA carboxylase carboxyltransferase component/biotin carboxyl carrier protein
VTEAVTGVDLVQTQIKIASGHTLHSLGVGNGCDRSGLAPRGFAMQCRINMEVLAAIPLNAAQLSDSRLTKPSIGFKGTNGLIHTFDPPAGLGVRVDSFAYVGYQTSTRYDSLLAKLIVHSSSSRYQDVIQRTLRALSEFNIEGVETNLTFLSRLLSDPNVMANEVYTSYVDDFISSISPSSLPLPSPTRKYFISSPPSTVGSGSPPSSPLSALDHPGHYPVVSPMQGTVTEITTRKVGAFVGRGEQIAVIEAMKMQHEVVTQYSGTVQAVLVRVGDGLSEGQALVLIERSSENETHAINNVSTSDDGLTEGYLNNPRPDLEEVIQRHAVGLDSHRADAVAKRHKLGKKTARENIANLVDEGSFVEYGALAIAAQKRRRSVEDLILNTPADGMVTGIGSVNSTLFSPQHNTQCIVMSYDYMVLAGTQGLQNHRKKDRMFELALSLKLPIILLAEGGGGRPGDTDTSAIAGLDCMAFALYARLSGVVPRVGIASGRCFAGNAALLGASDVIIATKDANIGMGGPAMIEGGGLGVCRPEEIGPISVQTMNGVVDIAVEDELQATEMAKKYLSYFQGSTAAWSAHDQSSLRGAIPENRLRAYDIRRVIHLIADVDSVLEMRPQFGVGIITCFCRIEGRPIGLIANNPMHLGGAIDSPSADKAARFMQLCDAFDIPLLSLCDTPGIMVGPEIEKTALVRHAARLFVTAGSISVPYFTIVLRKGYGLGAQAMAGGSFKSPVFTVAWPTGEFGGMGLEGAVKLGFKKELDAIDDPLERKKVMEKRISDLYMQGKAVNYANAFEIDDVIDPMLSRKWIVTGLKSSGQSLTQEERKKKRFVDTW